MLAFRVAKIPCLVPLPDLRTETIPFLYARSVKSIFGLIDQQRGITLSKCNHQDNHTLLTMGEFL